MNSEKDVRDKSIFTLLAVSDVPSTRSRIMRTILLYQHVYGGLRFGYTQGYSGDVSDGIDEDLKAGLIESAAPLAYSGSPRYVLTPLGMGLKRRLTEKSHGDVYIDGMNRILAFTRDLSDTELMGIEAHYYDDILPSLRYIADKTTEHTRLWGMRVEDIPRDTFEKNIRDGKSFLEKEGDSDDRARA